MALIVDNDPNTRAVRALVITCDHAGCAASNTDKEREASGGLLEMGWLRRFNERDRRNEYFCPEHKEEHRGN